MPLLKLNPGQPYKLPAGDYAIDPTSQPYNNGTIESDGSGPVNIVGTQRLYLRKDGGAENVTIRNINLLGPQLYSDQAGGHWCENVQLENVTFDRGSGITVKSGWKNSVVRNCGFLNHPAHPVYSDSGYQGVTIANCDFLNNRGGIHWDAPNAAGSFGLLLEQLYWEGLTAIGIELQTQSVDNPILQDITFASYNIIKPADLCPISAPLDQGKGAIIRRCWFAGGVTTYLIEAGGDFALYEDNYAAVPVGNNIFTEITDATGTWSAVVRNNRIPAGMRIFANNTLGTLTQGGNGPNATLTWDIARKPGRRGYRLPTAPIPSPVPLPSPLPPLRITGGQIDQNTGVGTFQVQK